MKAKDDALPQKSKGYIEFDQHIDPQVGHFISQFHVLFLSVALGSLATQPTTYLLLGNSLTLPF